MTVHPLLDAYVVMRNLCGDNFKFMDCCDFGNRWDTRSPYNGNLYVNFIALYEDKVVFLINSLVKEQFKEIFDSQKLDYEIVDYGMTVQFRVNMTPEQIIDFYNNFSSILEEIERNG